MYNMVRIGVAVPELQIADCAYNGEKIKELLDQGHTQGAQIMVFPELCLTGYTCGDLFFQSALHQGVERALGEILRHSGKMDMLFALGLPVQADNQMFNCAAIIHKGRILAIIPKTYLPNNREFYEERWFSSASDLLADSVSLCGQTVPMGSRYLFSCSGIQELVVGVEICEDLWCPIPPSSFQALSGANVILNLSASNELAAKGEYRRSLISGQSARLIAAYAYASAGMGESTTDLVFGGHSLICENGELLEEIQPFQQKSRLAVADVDVEMLMNYRRSTNSFMAHLKNSLPWNYETIPVPLSQSTQEPVSKISPTPFIPENRDVLERHCQEIFAIQYTALARRISHIQSKKSVIAVSGGLDSTLALLVTAKAHDFLELPRRDILGVTMPGFGTTVRTHQNALLLMKALGVEIMDIDIREACQIHMRDIGHNPQVTDTTFENIQARERTQVVMSLANQNGGIVVGTGDMSELALGYTTYNGDHMSMYNVNCGVPKTLVRILVEWIARSELLDDAPQKVLRDILDTPVSPELLPVDDQGRLQQKTEDLVGPYELHDFFLYHMLRNMFSPSKILFLAQKAFAGKYSSREIEKWMRLFYRRFFQQQFKRSCIPDGPKVGTISLSPRGDWRMPSDAVANQWLSDLNK